MINIKALPPTYNRDYIHIRNPILLNGISNCCKCNKKINTFSITGEPVIESLGDYTPILSYIKEIDEELLKIINRTRIKNIFYPDKSNELDENYYMNHCQYCGAKRGDYFLYDEPDGAFYIDDNSVNCSKLFYFKFDVPESKIFQIKARTMFEEYIPESLFKKERFLKDYTKEYLLKRTKVEQGSKTQSPQS